MKLDGNVASAAPIKLARALADPEILARIAPEGCAIGQKTGDTVPFKIQRKFGPVHITLSCTLTLQKKPDGPGFGLEIHGSHLIGGKVAINLDLTPQLPPAGPRRLIWTGTLEASGLAGHLAETRAVQVRGMVKDLILQVKAAVEAPSAANVATPASSD